MSDAGPGDVLLVVNFVVGGLERSWMDGRVSARVRGVLNR